MPVLLPVVLAGVGAATAGLVAGLATTAILINVALAVGSTLVLAAFSPKPGKARFEDRERTLTTRNPIAPRRIIYGRARVGGAIVFLQSTPTGNLPLTSGQRRNDFLTLVVALAGHEIDAVEEVWFNDDRLTRDINGAVTAPARYTNNGANNLVLVVPRLGTADQTAPAGLVSGSEGRWTAEDRLRGIAYLYCRLGFNQEAFASGIPNITAIVRGKRVFDPRSGTTGYSANPALCIRDYLLTAREDGGVGMTADEIDEPSFIAAANICDEAVPLAAGGTEPRYALSGIIDLSERNRPGQVLPEMLSSCAGKLVWQGGKWRLVVGAWRPATVTLTEADLAGGLRVQTDLSRRERFNGVRGTFINPSEKWQPTEFPPILGSTANDAGERVFRDLNFNWTTSNATAQRLARIELRKAAQPITVFARWKLTALRVQVGDTVNLTIPRLGWTAKAFEVTEWRFALEGDGALAIEMALRETAAEIYDWDAEDQPRDVAPNTDLPSPWVVGQPGLALSERRVVQPGALSVQLVATILPVPDAFVQRYEVQFRPSTETAWRAMGEGEGDEFIAADVLVGVAYQVRARAVNFAGARSDWTQVERTVQGRVTPPPNVTGFQATTSGDVTVLSWQPVADDELSHYAIRYSPDPTAIWSDMQVVVPRAQGNTVALQTAAGRYGIRAVTLGGLQSAAPAYALAEPGAGVDFNVVATLDEHPSFAGGKTDVEVVATTLRLVSGKTSGVYLFDQSLDLGEVFTSRVSARVESTIVERSGEWDAQSGRWDAQSGEWDGAVVESGAAVRVEMRTTPDNPAASPVWSAWQPVNSADVTARAFQFRAVLTAEDANRTPVVSVLSATVDMPDRVDGEKDILSNPAGTTITYSPAFQARPAVAITGYDLATGDYWAVTDSTRTGFTVRFFNSAGTGVARRFDWIARGFGRQH